MHIDRVAIAVSVSIIIGISARAAMWRAWSATSRSPMMPLSGTPYRNAESCEPAMKKVSNPASWARRAYKGENLPGMTVSCLRSRMARNLRRLSVGEASFAIFLGIKGNGPSACSPIGIAPRSHATQRGLHTLRRERHGS